MLLNKVCTLIHVSVVPALQLCLNHPPSGSQYRGPTVIICTTTVDQANQCHKRMLPPFFCFIYHLTSLVIRNLGTPLGIRSALCAGAAGSGNTQNEVAAIQRDAVHVLIGTPAKLNEVVTARGTLGGSECRLLIVSLLFRPLLMVLHKKDDTKLTYKAGRSRPTSRSKSVRKRLIHSQTPSTAQKG